jgi:uncharacterized glyoxalase superfamily protein PhnB
MSVRQLFPYLRVHDAERAVAFYREAFGATEIFRLVEPGGRIGHVEIDFAGSVVMVSEEYPEYGLKGPLTLGGTTVTLHLHVDDADAMVERAVNAGAALVRAPRDEFHGERAGTVRDPFGHEWLIGHEIEKLSPDEMQARFTRMLTSG